MAIANGTEPALLVRVAGEAPPAAARAIVAQPLAPAYWSRIPLKTVSFAFAKRTLDIVLSVVLLVLLSPVFLITGLLVKLTSPGPIIFRQTRVGRGGWHFTCYKFRSMCVDAEERRAEIQHLNEATGPVFKIRNDPRLTPIGKWLRKLSIDELPQLCNVLRGDMSLVGPRPPVPCEVERYGDRELMRLSVKPGLTCLWQVNGRSNISFDRWIELDIQYIESMSFWGDLAIILKTVPAVVSGRGAL